MKLNKLVIGEESAPLNDASVLQDYKFLWSITFCQFLVVTFRCRIDSYCDPSASALQL